MILADFWLPGSGSVSLKRIRIRLTKMKRIQMDPDPDPQHCFFSGLIFFPFYVREYLESESGLSVNPKPESFSNSAQENFK